MRSLDQTLAVCGRAVPVRGVEVAIVVVALCLGACRETSAQSTQYDIDSLTCRDRIRAAAQPSSLSALPAIASAENEPIAGRIVSHGHGGAAPSSPDETERPIPRRLASELREAAAAACALRTTAAAARAGYVLSSSFTQGVGTHWTNWRLIDEPFDPARPSMLLYATSRGEQTLVGFSYWVRTRNPDGPAGFIGTSDRWHRHFGLCFDRTGMVEREGVRNPRACAGAWLNGSDMWMLHAWIVPGHANTQGVFSAINLQLCSRTAPDIVRCPGVG
jgi:hypothetical protein